MEDGLTNTMLAPKPDNLPVNGLWFVVGGLLLA
jgi:hypothetical protein